MADCWKKDTPRSVRLLISYTLFFMSCGFPVAIMYLLLNRASARMIQSGYDFAVGYPGNWSETGQLILYVAGEILLLPSVAGTEKLGHCRYLLHSVD